MLLFCNIVYCNYSQLYLVCQRIKIFWIWICIEHHVSLVCLILILGAMKHHFHFFLHFDFYSYLWNLSIFLYNINLVIIKSYITLSNFVNNLIWWKSVSHFKPQRKKGLGILFTLLQVYCHVFFVMTCHLLI